ncbi:alpha/beta hydrolase [Leekyejoonella antrihumi]|uniref:Alpha/beta hydrolase n=1 Tax=Leekyejoonella antrihumi TaxID=1660198 RepID=A0A563E3N6_9MICO|nr:alpha/beta hydrolase [Leekyejoonella antrihumi]TWP36504.1 alpha/beta hydrolase [Leekyejoonella antrihumi]
MSISRGLTFRLPSAPAPLLPRRLPPIAARTVMRGLQRTVFQAGIPWDTQRTRLAMAAKAGRMPRGTRVTEETIAGLRVRRVRNASSAGGPLMVHLHGGGFCIGGPPQATAMAARLAKDAGADVLLPRYPLAPESPSPAAAQALRAFWDEVGTDRTVLSGESAGGNLALSLVLELRDSGGSMPAALALISPWLDLAADRSANAELARREPLLTVAWHDACADAYAAGRDKTDPALSPLNAALHGLPPTLVICGTEEILASDSHRVVRAIRDAGGVATLRIGDGLWHAFPLQAGMLREADEAVDEIAQLVIEAG